MFTHNNQELFSSFTLDGRRKEPFWWPPLRCYNQNEQQMAARKAFLCVSTTQVLFTWCTLNNSTKLYDTHLGVTHWLHTRLQQSSVFLGGLNHRVVPNLCTRWHWKNAFLHNMPSGHIFKAKKSCVCLWGGGERTSQELFTTCRLDGSTKYVFMTCTQVLLTSCTLEGSKVVHFLVTFTQMLLPIYTRNNSIEELFQVSSTQVLFPICSLDGRKEMHFWISFKMDLLPVSTLDSKIEVLFFITWA